MDLRGEGDDAFLDHLLGGNPLRLRFHCDPLIKHWWLLRIRMWRANFKDSLFLRWCKLVGRAWNQSPYFWGLVITPLHTLNGPKKDFVRLSDGIHLAFEFNRLDNVKCFYFADLFMEAKVPKRHLLSRHESPIYKERLEAAVREAICTWNLLSLRFGVPKDLRQQVAQVIWKSRSEWI